MHKASLPAGMAERILIGRADVRFLVNFARRAQRSAPRKFLEIIVSISRNIMLKSIDFSAAGDLFSNYDTKLLICPDF